MKRARRIFAIVTVFALLTGCQTNPYTDAQQASDKAKGAGVGAAAGAVVGALSGGRSSEDRCRNALIGVGVGALAGTAVGAYMDAQEDKLRKRLAGTGVGVTRTGDSLVLNMPRNVTFDVDRADVHANFHPVLNSVSLVLKQYEKTLIDVVGHTDGSGTLVHNMDLSQRRAAAVGRYLSAQGIDSRRIVTQGRGSQFPIASNDTPEGKQQNRRVELVLRPLTA